MGPAEQMKERYQRKMNVMGIKSTIHHAYLQLYAAKDYATATKFARWLKEVEMSEFISKDELMAIRKTAINEYRSGDYDHAIAALSDGGGSYAAPARILYLIEKLKK